MKFALSIATTTSLFVAAASASPTWAQQPILVESKSVSSRPWVDALAKRLKASLDNAVDIGMAGLKARTKKNGGIVALTFSYGPDGRPADLVLVRRSGDAHLDHLAYRAVAALSDLAPPSAATSTGQRVRAYLIAAPNQATLNAHARTVRSEETRRRSAAGYAQHEVAIIAE